MKNAVFVTGAAVGTGLAVAMRFAKEGYDVAGTYHVGSTIGTHVGPGAFGIIYIGE